MSADALFWAGLATAVSVRLGTVSCRATKKTYRLNGGSADADRTGH
jgi:hypothetical protein